MFVEGSRAECHSLLAGGETVLINSILLTYEPLPEAHSDYLCTQVRGGCDSVDITFPVTRVSVKLGSAGGMFTRNAGEGGRAGAHLCLLALFRRDAILRFGDDTFRLRNERKHVLSQILFILFGDLILFFS